MTLADPTLLFEIRRALRQVAVPADAAPMQRYMKSAMPYLGIKTPVRTKVTRPLFRAHPQPDWPHLRDTVLTLWREAEFREERMVAIDLACQTRYRRFLQADSLPAFEELIVTGAWWDYVDWIAKQNVGVVLQNDPEALKPLMRAWAKDTDLWKRRTAILCQLGLKDKTDASLLADCIQPSLGAAFILDHQGSGQSQGHPMLQKDVNFFLRKAIGWNLRDYAKTDPDWVVAYVTAHAQELSNLSKREATRILVKQGVLDAMP